MNDENQTEPTPGAIDAEQLLASLPDESSDGLPRAEIRDAYAAGRPPFSDEEFDAALDRLEAEGHVRTTSRRVFGTRIQYYRRSSR